MNCEPNAIDWEVGDLVIHDNDEKSERMLMRVIEIDLPFGMVGTEYVNDIANTQHREHFLNSKRYLHDPMRFLIGAPIVHVNDESEPWEIYTRALNTWGIDPQLNMFIEEAAEAIQAVQHHRRGRCDMDTVCGELSDLQVMLEQMKIVYGTDRFERIFAEKIYALDEKLSECEKGL